MPTKEVYLYDDSNMPLKVKGIQMELFNAKTGKLIDKELSDNRNPTMGTRSKEWGGDLNFPSSSDPLDIYITDTRYEYPGNTVQSLNGDADDRIDIDLLKIPTGPMSAPPSANSTPITIVNAIKEEPEWDSNEKRAAINLLMNYISTVYKGTISSPELTPELETVISNWDKALNRLGIDGIDLGIPVFDSQPTSPKGSVTSGW